MIPLIENRKNFKIVGKYDNAFLDDMLHGIAPEDFVLIGAASGVGKTEFAYDLAFNMAKTLQVHLFALEADKDEPYYRRLYKMVAEAYYKDAARDKGIHMSYDAYRMGDINVDKYETDCKLLMDEMYPGLHVHYREGQFNINTLNQTIMESVTRHGCDIIVIDHLDYFDVDLTQNENMQMSELMKNIRDINQAYRVPIIAVSHLRKKYNRASLIPDIDDFIGSGSKVKQVKTIILLARDYGTPIKNGMASTFISVPKRRIGGTYTVAARIMYDLKKNAYENEYELNYIQANGDAVKKVDDEDLPFWATHAIRGGNAGFEMVPAVKRAGGYSYE